MPKEKTEKKRKEAEPVAEDVEMADAEPVRSEFVFTVDGQMLRNHHNSHLKRPRRRRKRKKMR